MFKDFKKYNFSVIDVTMSTMPEMTINLNGISFNARTLDVLGSPEFVRPLLDTDNKAFAIQVAKATDDKAMKFTKTEKGGGFSSTCNVIRATLRRLMGDAWKDNMRYNIRGIYFPDGKVVVFELNSAVELPSFRNSKVNAAEQQLNSNEETSRGSAAECFVLSDCCSNGPTGLQVA